MSDEKPKPFARVEPYAGPDGRGFRVPDGMGTHAVVIDTSDGDRCVWPGTEPYARHSVERLNAAVAAREAKLRGVLAEAYAALRDLVNVANNVGPVEAGSAVWHHAARVSADIVAIGADGVPDYVPRAELDAERAKVKALQAAIDALEPGRYATGEQVAAWLEANGLKKPRDIPLSERAAAVRAAGSQGLIRELERRGADRAWLSSVMASLAGVNRGG